MYGHLIPQGGGNSVRLEKRRLFFGRSRTVAKGTPLTKENAWCELEFVEGWWHIEDLRCPGGVRVNGRACKRVRLSPDDEIAVGKYRYRIEFDPPKYIGKDRLGSASPRARDESVAEARPAREAGETGRSAARPTGPHGRLVPLGGGEDFPLREASVTVGRRAPCAVVVKHATISSVHCRLSFVDGFWQVEDLGSRNGVRVDGVPCHRSWVFPESRLSIAKLHYRLEYEAAGVRPPPLEEPAIDDRPLLAKLGLKGRAEEDLLSSLERQQLTDEPERKRYDLADD